MQVINIHKRIINQSIEKVSPLLKSLATKEDLIWPYEKWPAIRFKEGLQVGSKGGHGTIKYTIIEFNEGESVTFQFSKPKGFNGIHKFMIVAMTKDVTEIRHEIRTSASWNSYIMWVFVIRWLHDALIEDAFDKVESHFIKSTKVTRHNLWVRFLREVYKRKTFLTSQS